MESAMSHLELHDDLKTLGVHWPLRAVGSTYVQNHVGCARIHQMHLEPAKHTAKPKATHCVSENWHSAQLREKPVHCECIKRLRAGAKTRENGDQDSER
eukprot:3449363-Pleurochrysis_carterae.AAC.3